jgi:hypothetical protein
MAITELVRAAQRISETAECEDARHAARQALAALAWGEIEDAIQALNLARWMSA